MASSVTSDVLIVGGGAGGIACAASLLRRKPELAITIIEPSETHYYQPGWTLVGAGVFRDVQTRRSMISLMPKSVRWIRDEAARFDPVNRQVVLRGGEILPYRCLVVATGVKLDWDAIPGLSEALGRNGVTSNYRYDLAPYTWRLVKELDRGTAIFTQPPMPIKCSGAPQKALYLACDHWRRQGHLRAIAAAFHSAAPSLFGVAHYVPELIRWVEAYGVDLRLKSTLVTVDGLRKVATFRSVDDDGREVLCEREFDMLHAVPPQIAPDMVRTSALADRSGFVAVNPATLRHQVYPEVFALGDCISATNAKTAAAVRKQAPVVASNVIAALEGSTNFALYDGYGSCPLTVAQGRIVLAEFGYGGALKPTLPVWMLDGLRPTRLAWLLKRYGLPALYWHAMLKGREWLARPMPQ